MLKIPRYYRPFAGALRCAVLISLMLSGGQIQAADQSKAGSKTGEQSQTKCVKGCQRWVNACNIDPRTGTRKCRRRCDKFGEICE